MAHRVGIVRDHKIVAGRTLVTLLVGALAGAGCGGPNQVSLTQDPTSTLEPVSTEEIRQTLQRLAVRATEQPSEPYWPTMMAVWSQRAGDADAVAAHLQQALALDPDYAPALSRWTKWQYETGHHEEAIAQLEASRARRGELPEALRIGLALHYQAMDRLDEAETIVATLDPEDASGIRGFRLLTGDDYLQAFESTERAVREHPDVASHHNNHGISLLYRGEPERARDEFLKALELQPGLAGAMYNLAIVEKFYFFDDDASRGWFARYRQRSDADPDGLRELLAVEAQPTIQGK